MKKERNISIDRFRGLIVFLMVFFQLLEHFPSLGKLAEVSVHSPDCVNMAKKVLLSEIIKIKGIYLLPNMTLADFIAPAFIFAISLTFIPSYKRKIEKFGKKIATKLMLERYTIIVGLGMMMTGINCIIDGDFSILAIIIEFITIISVLLGLIWLFTKKNKVGKFISKILKYLTLLVGVIGIAIVLYNAILYVTGLSEINLGFWLVFQHIGLAGIVATLVMYFSKNNSTSYRLIMGLLILGLFTIFHETALPTLKNNLLITNNMRLIDNTADGGFIGGLAYGGMLLLFTVFSDLYYKNVDRFRKWVLALLIPVGILLIYNAFNFTAYDGSNNLLTAGLSNHFTINKGSISPGYLLVTLFSSTAMFMIVDLFKNKKLKFDFLAIWGENPLLVYLLEFGLIGGVMAIVGDYAETASILMSSLIVVTLILTINIILIRLHNKKKVIKI